jgi:N-acetylneuraminic acid mutarotase
MRIGNAFALWFLVQPFVLFAQSAPPPPIAPTLAWQEGTAIPVGRDHHATFLVRSRGGDYLYVAGGTDYKNVFDDVWRAKIGANGTLGTWESAGTLPTPRAGISVAVGGDVAVLTAGQFQGLKKTAESYTARVRPNGTLGPWQAAPTLPSPRFHHSSLHHNGWVYVTGGQGENGSDASVLGGKLEKDGAIREWTVLTAMPRPRSHHASFVHAGHLYVVAGLDGNPADGPALLSDIRRAEILPDGTLGAWKLISLMPHALGTHSAFVEGDHLYVLGGVEDNARFVNTIWQAPIAADGKIGAWKALETGLPAARGHVHDTPVLNGRVYSAGGSNMRRVRSNVDVGTINR